VSSVGSPLTGLRAMTTSTPSKSSPSYEAIKLGIDAHAKYYWVSRQVDGATPQPVQKNLLFAPFPQLARAVSSPGALKLHPESLRQRAVEVWRQRLQEGTVARSSGELDLSGMNGGCGWSFR
jgi:hypothetical protein